MWHWLLEQIPSHWVIGNHKPGPSQLCFYSEVENKTMALVPDWSPVGIDGRVVGSIPTWGDQYEDVYSRHCKSLWIRASAKWLKSKWLWVGWDLPLCRSPANTVLQYTALLSACGCCHGDLWYRCWHGGVTHYPLLPNSHTGRKIPSLPVNKPKHILKSNANVTSYITKYCLQFVNFNEVTVKLRLLYSILNVRLGFNKKPVRERVTDISDDRWHC